MSLATLKCHSSFHYHFQTPPISAPPVIIALLLMEHDAVHAAVDSDNEDSHDDGPSAVIQTTMTFVVLIACNVVCKSANKVTKAAT